MIKRKLNKLKIIDFRKSKEKEVYKIIDTTNFDLKKIQTRLILKEFLF